MSGPEDGESAPAPTGRADTARAGAILDREQRREIGAYLRRQLAGPVALDLWTRTESSIIVPGRAPCESCGPMEETLRALAALHPGITLTRYDRDRHAARAEQEAIESLPTVIVRGRGGAGFRMVGMPAGPLFRSFLDGLIFAAAADGGLSAEGRELAAELQHAHRLTLHLAPYDPFSPFLLRLAAGVAAQQPLVQLEAVAIAEFPTRAQTQRITHVPTVAIDGLRGQGLFSELELLRQLAEAETPTGADGQPQPLVRGRDDAMAYRSLADLRRTAEQGQRPGGAPPP